MEWIQGQIIVEADGSLLVGGHSEAPAFLDAGTARRHGFNRDHEPVIPGSALRGVLREALSRWLRTDGLSAPEPWEDGDPESPLTRLFGSRGSDRPGLMGKPQVESRMGLRIEDAVLKGEPAFGVRTGVGVDRYTGHAVEGRLYQREVAEASGSRFVAPFEGNVLREDVELLAQACALVDGVGNSRSRGLGAIRVRLEIDPPAPQSLRPVQIAEMRSETDLATIELLAETDLHLGDVPDKTSLRESLDFVPGSALRGALVWALVDAGLRGAPGFLEIAEAARFSDLWPIEGSLSEPEPRTLMGCRAHGRESVQVDAILSLSLLPHLLEHGGAPAVWRCPHCGKPLRPVGRLPSAVSRIVTRLALDPQTGSAAPGMLHARQQIIAGARFRGTASGLGKEARDLLARLERPVRVGGLRSRGLGRVSIELKPFEPGSIRDALSRFDRQARSLVPDELAAFIGLPGSSWVQLVARTPLRLPKGVEPEASGDWIARELFGEGAVAVASHQRTGARSGFRDRSWEGGYSDVLPVFAVIRAGSTWLFRLPGPINAQIVEATTRSATAGVGELTELGLGRLSPPPRPMLTPPARSSR